MQDSIRLWSPHALRSAREGRQTCTGPRHSGRQPCRSRARRTLRMAGEHPARTSFAVVRNSIQPASARLSPRAMELQRTSAEPRRPESRVAMWIRRSRPFLRGPWTSTPFTRRDGTGGVVTSRPNGPGNGKYHSRAAVSPAANALGPARHSAATISRSVMVRSRRAQSPGTTGERSLRRSRARGTPSDVASAVVNAACGSVSGSCESGWGMPPASTETESTTRCRPQPAGHGLARTHPPHSHGSPDGDGMRSVETAETVGAALPVQSSGQGARA